MQFRRIAIEEWILPSPLMADQSSSRSVIDGVAVSWLRQCAPLVERRISMIHKSRIPRLHTVC